MKTDRELLELAAKAAGIKIDKSKYSVGSTVAAALCKEFGLDPDDMVHK